MFEQYNIAITVKTKNTYKIWRQILSVRRVVITGLIMKTLSTCTGAAGRGINQIVINVPAGPVPGRLPGNCRNCPLSGIPDYNLQETHRSRSSIYVDRHLSFILCEALLSVPCRDGLWEGTACRQTRIQQCNPTTKYATYFLKHKASLQTLTDIFH